MLKKLLGEHDSILFWITLIFMAFAITTGALYPVSFSNSLNHIQSLVVNNFSWWLLMVCLSFLIFCLWLCFSKYGNIKLGKENEKPDYNLFSYVAMLFSCGISISFIFWGVAEPLYHYMQTPYLAQPQSNEAVAVGLSIAVFHQGFQGWAIFGVIGVTMAFLSYKLDKPMAFSTTLYGLIGDRIHGPIGRVVDALAAFATIAGISTSLGLGIMSISYGVNHLFGIEINNYTLVIILIFFIFAYVLSAASGIDRGIKQLSNLNIYLAGSVALFLLIVGPTNFILNLMSDTLGSLLNNFFQMSLWTDSVANSGWPGSWTVFYWCWWIAWGPFVGGFIARISRGRTIREFMASVIFIPTLMGLIWYSIVGGTTLYSQINGVVDVWSAIQSNLGSGIYVLLNAYPGGSIVAYIIFFNVLTFLVTSADSSSFFVAMIMSKGNKDPKTAMRIIWGIVIGSSALILLLTGGLKALQTAAILAGLPFSIIVVAVMFSLVKILKKYA